jgi:hydrophobic/amphiphilic exporter-1 (mainly G- bacteria), HAE1 family
VAELFIGGGVEKELHIEVSAERLALYGLTIPRLIEILRSENVDISAGTLGVGRRDYRIRTTAEFRSKEEIEDLIVVSTGQRRVRLGEIAQVRDGYQKRVAATLHMGREGIAIGVKPEPDANILELTDRLEQVVQWLNEEKLKPRTSTSTGPTTSGLTFAGPSTWPGATSRSARFWRWSC